MKISHELKRKIFDSLDDFDKLSYFFWRIQATLFFFLPIILAFNILIYLVIFDKLLSLADFIVYSCFALICILTSFVMPIVLIRLSRKIISRKVKK